MIQAISRRNSSNPCQNINAHFDRKFKQYIPKVKYKYLKKMTQA